MNRRKFLKSTAAGMAAAGALAPLTSAAPAFAQSAGPARKPNFLFVYTDDQRFDALGVVQREQGDAGRWPWLKTPHMDRVANEGLRFRNAFVVNSLCAPSRACFLSGRYSHLNGVANNHTPFPVDSVTHATVLRQAGYKTAYCGKWHMGSQSGQRPGFDFSASYIGQGKYMDCPVEINGQSTPTTGYVDNVITDFAIKFIKENKDNPFSIVVGIKAVHGPRTPAEAHKTAYTGMEIEPPVNASALPPFNQRGQAANSPEVQVGPAAEPAQGGRRRGTSEGTLDYFRTLNGADDNLGRLLATLDELGLAQDTVVAFAGDNGYYLGEHGLGDKRSAYDESLRIPLLLRYPRLVKPGTRVDQLVLNIDLAPTIVDLAGAPVPALMQGRSWKPLLENKSEGWRRAFFYEYFQERGFGTPTVLATRTEDAKLVKYPGHDDWTELFDLKADPREMKNLIKDPGARDLLARMETEFEAQSKAVQYRFPEFADQPGDASMTGSQKTRPKKEGKKGARKEGRRKKA